SKFTIKSFHLFLFLKKFFRQPEKSFVRPFSVGNKLSSLRLLTVSVSQYAYRLTINTFGYG
ncbi:MAG: hypothetical protein IJ780_05630, partial [Neisseriaceae bacterium]|nr:hypothetical protein [Neisseriaceae bacterium]